MCLFISLKITWSFRLRERAMTQTIEDGKSLCVSTLVITEIISGTSNPKALEFLQASKTAIYDLTKDIAIAAGDLRRLHKSLKTADAIHLATSIVAGATHFITNDKKLLGIQTKLKMIPLLYFSL